MTITYHGPTIEACMKEVKHAGFDEASDLMTALRSLPVAEWTRERPTKAGWYAESDTNGHVLIVRYGECQHDGQSLVCAQTVPRLARASFWFHLDPLLPPPPAAPTREGE